MTAEYDYDYAHIRGQQMNTNVIDHRPSLLRSTRQLIDRSPSPTFSRSQKLPMQEIYRSLMQNRPNMNIDKVIMKQKHLESLSNPPESNSSTSVKVSKSGTKNTDVQRNPTGKAPPSPYRQKTCDGCAHTRQMDKRVEFEESKLGEKSRTCSVRPSSYSTRSRNRNTQSSNYTNSKPSWTFGRQNSTASSYRSTTNESSISSVMPSARSHWSTRIGREIGSESISSQTEDLSPSPSSSTTARTDTSKHSKTRRNKTPLHPKPEALKKIFIVNGSVVSFNGYGFESFTNWFGDETMLRTESKRAKSLVHKELDMSGFTNQEINMKLYDGNKLVIEASRPLRGRYPAMRFKDTILLPKGLSVESLIVCRTKSGRLVIEDISRPYSQPSQKETEASTGTLVPSE